MMTYRHGSSLAVVMTALFTTDTTGPLSQLRARSDRQSGCHIRQSQSVGLPSIASGSATVAGVEYDDVEFRGPFRFDTVLVTIPPAPPELLQLVTVTTPFVLSGRLKGYDVLNTREPILAFDVG